MQMLIENEIRQSRLRIWLFVYLLFCMFVTLWTLQWGGWDNPGPVAFIVLVFSFYILWISNPRRHMSAPFIFLVVFSVFHLGLAIPFSFGYDPDGNISYVLYRWRTVQYFDKAIVLVCIAIAGLLLGVLFHLSFMKLSSNRSKYYDFDRHRLWNQNKYLTNVGFSTLLFGLSYWLLLLVSHGGPSAIFYSYHQYLTLSAVKGFDLGVAYMLINVGLSMLVSVEPSKLKRKGIILFLFWVPLGFIMGLRGEVLFPSAVAFILMGRRGYNIRLRVLVPAVTVVLFAIALVSVFRGDGISSAEINNIEAGPIDALVEMGSSIRPVTVVLKWERFGQESLYGGSYVAPVERMFLKVFPLWQRLHARDDYRLLNVLVQEREGAIGFSSVAEAYVNFGTWGVLFVFMLTGYFISYLDRLRAASLNNAIVGVVLIPIFVQIRNAFAPIPAQVLMSLIIVSVAIALAAHSAKSVELKSSEN